MRLLLLLTALVLGLQTGSPPVEKDKNRGGPGATKEAQKLPQEVKNDRTFRLHVPPDLRLSPGQRKEVTVSLEPGLSFRQQVRLYFGAPEGICVLPGHAQIQPGDKQTTITITATRDVLPGDRTLRLVGEPETGESVLMQVPVHVDRPE